MFHMQKRENSGEGMDICVEMDASWLMNEIS